jgi:hypothetical protein
MGIMEKREALSENYFIVLDYKKINWELDLQKLLLKK